MDDKEILCNNKMFIEEVYSWNDDVLRITKSIVNQIDDMRMQNISEHFDVDLSEIREFLEMKKRKANMYTNADNLRDMDVEEMALWFGTHACCMKEPLSCSKPSGYCKKCWRDWLARPIYCERKV